MATPTKDTIYIDIDDEITTIIDKLSASKAKVVALVLPKRATVLQSIVNMKLLKRASDESKKSVVLITTEAGLLPLAGASGMYVASSLNSKPEIPTPPDSDESEEMIDEDEPETDSKAAEITAATAGAVAVGALAGLPPKPKDEMETLQLEDDSESEADDDDSDTASDIGTPVAAAKKDKKLHVPNFERFRLWLIIAACAFVLLIVGAVFANKILPKATITIKTNAQNYNTNVIMNLATTATTVDLQTGTIPAKAVTQQKTYTQQVTSTGQKNNGVKATGTVTMTAKKCSGNPFIPPSDVPAGWGISTAGLTYITQTAASFHGTGTDGSGCYTYASNSSVNIIAQTGGAKYNIGTSNFSVNGRSDAAASGSASGGTDDIQQVVSQADIDNAKSKISTNDQAVKQTLTTQLTQAGYYPIGATFQAGTPTVTTSANVGDAATSVTVTEVIVYTMFGAHEADMKVLIANSLKSQIDIKQQSILDYGIAGATYSLQSSTDKTAQVTSQNVVTVGPKLNEEQIKTESAGKKSGQAIQQISETPGVTSVSVKLSPFWVSSIPTNTSKITVVIEKPTKATNSSNSNANP